MRLKTLAYYVLREGRDLVEYVLLPGLTVILPWSWSFRIFRRIARWDWLHRRYCRGAYEQASRYVDIPDPKQWQQRYRLLWLLDASELHIARFRPKAFMRPDRFEVVGKWPEQGDFVAMGLHWGPGGLIFRELNRNGFLPRVVFRRNVLGFREQSLVENLYRRWRPRQYAKIGGGEPISTGGGFRAIKQILDEKDVLIIFFDVPPEPTSKPVAVDMMGHPAHLRSGVIRLVARPGVSYVKYRIGYNLQNGRRRLEIFPPVNSTDEQEVALDLASFLDSCIEIDSAQWSLWRHAPLFFDIDSAGGSGP